MRGHTSKHQKAIENYRFAGIFNTKLISFLIHVRLSLSLKKSKNRHEESFISVISYTFFFQNGRYTKNGSKNRAPNKASRAYNNKNKRWILLNEIFHVSIWLPTYHITHIILYWKLSLVVNIEERVSVF